MTRTARRRWSRELPTQIDGIAIAGSGPVLVHGYDQPAGGKWIDSVIPGKLAALDRTSGETRWFSPCEVGYGRGFGAGLGAENDVLVLGPSQQGHRIARMDLATGELIAARTIDAFDTALVAPDLCLCVAPRRVSAIHPGGLVEIWAVAREKERYHLAVRDGARAYVVYTNEALGLQGVLTLDVESGRVLGRLLDPSQQSVHGIAAADGAVALVVSQVEEALPPDAFLDVPGAQEDDPPLGLGLIAIKGAHASAERALWHAPLGEVDPEFPEVALHADSGKLYIARGADLQVRDLLSGRPLGELAVPGLDESVAWAVVQGAGLLAEETRVSIFEVPD